MIHGAPVRLRALALLVTLGIGFLSQVAAAVAMPMQMPQPAAATVGIGGAEGGCADCAGDRHNPATPADCAVAVTVFCSALPALLPAAPTMTPLPQATFQPAALHREIGITIRPDLGPPRPILHS